MFKSEEAPEMKGTTALKILVCARQHLSMVALAILLLPVLGCLESSFNLANDSRMPSWITLPPGVTREEVSITLSYYTTLGGDDVQVTLKDERGKTLAEVRGRLKCHSSFSSYPAYDAVVANGMTEIIEHKKMEPVFDITDDPTVKAMLFARDGPCGQS